MMWNMQHSSVVPFCLIGPLSVRSDNIVINRTTVLYILNDWEISLYLYSFFSPFDFLVICFLVIVSSVSYNFPCTCNRNFLFPFQCCGSASTWCGSGSCLSLWCGSGSSFLNKGSKPWKNAHIGSYSIHILTCNLKIDADPDPAYHFDPDPDPTFQFDVDPGLQHCSIFNHSLLYNFLPLSPYFLSSLLLHDFPFLIFHKFCFNLCKSSCPLSSEHPPINPILLDLYSVIYCT